MRVGNFEIQVWPGLERDSGHVELAHGQVYKIKLVNHCMTRRCDALVVVDGKDIGGFRVGAGSTITIETPPDDPGKGCFTFYRMDSLEGMAAGADRVASVERGLIQVTFKAEVRREPQERTSGGIHLPEYGLKELKAREMGGYSSDLEPPTRSMSPPTHSKRYGACGQSAGGQHTNCSRGLSAGVTGLSGRSNQTFTYVKDLVYDPESITVISLRLVCSGGVRELVSSPRANPVPGVVG